MIEHVPPSWWFEIVREWLRWVVVEHDSQGERDHARFWRRKNAVAFVEALKRVRGGRDAPPSTS